jgi:hypothetical protein
VAAHGVDEASGELLDRRVAHAQSGAVALDVVADRVEQMGLAEPRLAVQEKRVVGLGGQLRHGERSRVGEAVALADHELVEAVLRVQPRAALAVESGGRAGGWLIWWRCGPGRPDDLHDRLRVEARGRGAPQQGQVALGDRGADVFRRAHVEGLAVHARQLEGIDPEVELEVGSVATKLVADVVP